MHAGLSVPAIFLCASSAMNTDKLGGSRRSSCSCVLPAAAQGAINSLGNSGILNISQCLMLVSGGCSSANRPIRASIFSLCIFCHEYRQIGWNPAFLLQLRSSCSCPSCHQLRSFVGRSSEDFEACQLIAASECGPYPAEPRREASHYHPCCQPHSDGPITDAEGFA